MLWPTQPTLGNLNTLRSYCVRTRESDRQIIGAFVVADIGESYVLITGEVFHLDRVATRGRQGIDCTSNKKTVF